MSLPAEKATPSFTRPAAAVRRGSGLNLSRRPFVNTRPVTRLSILLWLLGGLLLLANVSLFWSYRSGSATKLAELARLDGEIARQRQTVSQLQQRLNQLDIAQQNQQVRYLNRKISERTFSWSLLFDRLAEVLPDNVRVIRLAPVPLARAQEERASRMVQEEAGPLDERVHLTITGEAKDDESLDAFVDNLFAHPSFGDPQFSREAREEEGDLVRFDIQAIYIPGRNQQGIVVEEAPGPEIVETPPAGQTTPATPTSPTPPADPESELE